MTDDLDANEPGSGGIDPLRGDLAALLPPEMHTGHPMYSRRAAMLLAALATSAALLAAEGLSASPAYAAVSFNKPFTFDAPISSGFGMRVHPITGIWTMHDGADYAPATGTAIRAIASGTVIERGTNPGAGYGYFLRVAHAEGWQSLYAHMQAPSPIALNQVVGAAAVLGGVGATGNVNGPHLHLEIRQNGSLRDPVIVLANAPFAGQAPPQGDEFDMATLNDLRTIVREEMNLRGIQRELIQTPDGTVWVCFDRMFRIAVPNPTNLTTIITNWSNRGIATNITPRNALDANAFGVPMFVDDVNRIARKSDIPVG